MSNSLNNGGAASLFGDVIATYTRAQAIADGVLIDASTLAREADFKWPVALTAAAWADCVAWSEQDNHTQVYQDEPGRLWDVLYSAYHAIRTTSASGDRLRFDLVRVPRDGASTAAVLTTLKLIVGPGDQGEPVVTLMLPNED